MIKIVAVDDSQEYLDSLELIFRPHKEKYKLVKCFSKLGNEDNVKYLLQNIGELAPDAILMDFSFVPLGRPSDYGIELVRRILAPYPDQKIIMLVADDDDSDKEVWEKIRRSFNAGALAYLSKQDISSWKDAISEVVKGEHFVNQNATKAILKGLGADIDQNIQLSERQREVLIHLASDKTISQVAESIKGINGKPISIHTANFHLRNIRARLLCSTLHGVVAKAMRKKIID